MKVYDCTHPGRSFLSFQIESKFQGCLPETYSCLCTGTSIEREGKDRKDLDLPGHQLQLLQDAVQSGNKKMSVFSVNPSIFQISKQTEIEAHND